MVNTVLAAIFVVGFLLLGGIVILWRKLEIIEKKINVFRNEYLDFTELDSKGMVALCIGIDKMRKDIEEIKDRD